MVPPKSAQHKRGCARWMVHGQESALAQWTVLLSAALIVLAILTGILSLVDPEESTAERITRTGVVRIGYATEIPFAFEDPRGRVTGEIPEVARIIWQQLGIQRIEWVRTGFASLIPQLRAGRFDQIASNISIRPDRHDLVVCTTPSTDIVTALLVRRGNPQGLHSYRDIVINEGIRLAVLDESAELAEASQAGIPPERIIRYPNAELARQAIRTGIADALALPAPPIRQLTAANEDMQRALPFEAAYTPPGCGSFVFRKNESQLCHRFDRALRAFVGSREHRQLLQSLELDTAALPPPPHLQQRENDS